MRKGKESIEWLNKEYDLVAPQPLLLSQVSKLDMLHIGRLRKRDPLLKREGRQG
jgi:hypothetical protein